MNLNNLNKHLSRSKGTDKRHNCLFAYCNILTQASAGYKAWYLHKDYRYDFHEVAKQLVVDGYTCKLIQPKDKGIREYYEVSGWEVYNGNE